MNQVLELFLRLDGGHVPEVVPEIGEGRQFMLSSGRGEVSTGPEHVFIPFSLLNSIWRRGRAARREGEGCLGASGSYQEEARISPGLKNGSIEPPPNSWGDRDSSTFL